MVVAPFHTDTLSVALGDAVTGAVARDLPASHNTIQYKGVILNACAASGVVSTAIEPSSRGWRRARRVRAYHWRGTRRCVRCGRQSEAKLPQCCPPQLRTARLCP